MGSPEISDPRRRQGWPDDADRFLASLDATPGRSLRGGGRRGAGRDVGFGSAQNRALAEATGDVVVIVDTSLELTGDLLGALVGRPRRPDRRRRRPFGLATADLCDYEERTAGDVAAMQGYCLAARRADLVAAGGVQEAFTWYRNADIDVSLRLRTLTTPPAGRAVAAGAEHCTRHTHRAWEATPEAERGSAAATTWASSTRSSSAGRT